MSLKSLFTIGSANIVGTALSGIFWFVLATLINPDEYGVLNYFVGLASIAYGLSCFGTINTMTVYTAKKIDLQSTLFSISLIGGLISSIVLYVFFQRIDVLLLTFGYIISSMAIGIQFGNKSFSKYAKLLLIQKVLTLVLGLGFYFWLGIDGIIIALALTYVCYITIIIDGFKHSKLSFDLFKKKIKFIGNNYLIILTGVFREHTDKLIIVPILGFSYLGNYSLASQVIVVLMIIPSTVFKYILPFDSTGQSNRKIKSYTITTSVILATIGFFIIPTFIGEIFPKFEDVSESIRIMSISIIPLAISLILTSEFLGKEKSSHVLIGSIITLSTMISGILILGPIYEAIGIAYAFVISSISQCIFLAFAHFKRMNNENQKTIN
jgi:O-antigen/teichoic acid export membrane protein